MPGIAGPGEFGSAATVRKYATPKTFGIIYNLKAGESLTVRFLEEPGKWHGYYQHWIAGKPIWCTGSEDGCEGCGSDDDKERKQLLRYLVNALNIAEGKVIVLQMPMTLADAVMQNYDKRQTLLDRDYELKRTGAGQNDTKYSALAEDPRRMNLDRYASQLHSIPSVVSAEAGISPVEDEKPKKKSRVVEDDEEEPTSTKPKKKKKDADMRESMSVFKPEAPAKAAKKVAVKKTGTALRRPLKRTR